MTPAEMAPQVCQEFAEPQALQAALSQSNRDRTLDADGAHQDRGETLVLQGDQEMRDHRAFPETTAPTLSQATTGFQDPQDRQAQPETRDQPELQEMPDEMGPLVDEDQLDSRAETATQAGRDLRDHRASRATGDHRDRRDLRDHQASQETQDHQGRTVSQANRDLREKTPSTAPARGERSSTRSRPPGSEEEESPDEIQPAPFYNVFHCHQQHSHRHSSSVQFFVALLFVATYSSGGEKS